MARRFGVTIGDTRLIMQPLPFQRANVVVFNAE